MYEQQRLFTTALLQQIPPDTKHDSISTPVSIRAPKVKKRLQRQGPFLLQPAPKMLPGETGETTDIMYLLLGGTATTTDASSAGQIGVLVVANQDGRTDICLDLEKVEAQWEGEVWIPRCPFAFSTHVFAEP
jgi:nucleoporin NUP82